MGAAPPRRLAATALVAIALAATATSVRARRPDGRRTAVGRPPAQPVVEVASGGESIPTIRTARGVTTMLSLPGEAREAVCGDLYDPQSGNGGFVLQRSGRDIFLKPLRAGGRSNLFVKTERATYAFELEVVDAPQAMRIVYVDDAVPTKALEAERARLARERSALEADRLAVEAERSAAADDLARRRAELDREAAARAEALASEWIAASLERGAALLPVGRRSAKSGDLELTLAEAALTVGRRVFVRCSLRNAGATPVTVASAELVGKATRRAAAGVAVTPGATSTFVLTFDGEPSRDATLRLLDSAGAPLLSLRPFR